MDVGAVETPDETPVVVRRERDVVLIAEIQRRVFRHIGDGGTAKQDQHLRLDVV